MTNHLSAPPLRRTRFGVMISVFGIVAVAVYLVPETISGVVPIPQATVPFAVVAVLAWIVTLLVPMEWVWAQRILYLLMVVAGASAAWGTNGLLIIPVIAGVVQAISWDELPWVGYSYALVAGGLVAGGALVTAGLDPAKVTIPSVLSLEAAVLIAVLGGANRRQARARELARLDAAAQAEAMREEQARTQALAVRQGLARDLHDVLAHSLGGLVIQLDAVEAQLEAGESDAALTRLHDARAMAASGLAEARRAVEALRAEPSAASVIGGIDLAASIIDLVDAHERLGGRVDFEQSGEPRSVSDDSATALRRAVQESLSNARKHAPGEPVRVRIVWSRARVELTVTNPVPATVPAGALAASGSGRGLLGMRERFGALPGGEMSGGMRGGEFVVHVSVALEAAEGESIR